MLPAKSGVFIFRIKYIERQFIIIYIKIQRLKKNMKKQTQTVSKISPSFTHLLLLIEYTLNNLLYGKTEILETNHHCFESEVTSTV